MKLIIFALTIVCSILLLSSCGTALVHSRLADKIYLIAPDEIEQLSVAYNYSGSSFSDLVHETVIAVGYNDDFIIVKQRPTNLDTVLYYIVDVKKIKMEREKFISKVDTLKYQSVYKDINNKDSLGPIQIDTLTTKFSPKEIKPLTFEIFKAKRKELNIPNNLDFLAPKDFERLLWHR